MDVRDLETFLAVLESSGVSKAAAIVNRSPAAISEQLHHLASDLGVDLFVRSGKRIVPTPAAWHLAELARDVVHRMRSIEIEFRSDPASDRRPFHFGTGATMLIHHLGRPLRLLRKSFPNSPIEITVAGTDQMIADLRARRLDLALISALGEQKDLTILPLFDEEMLIVKPAAALSRAWHIGSIRTSELAEAQFLLYPQGSVMRAIVENFFREAHLTPRVAMEADDAQAIHRLVEAGFGYSILPEYALRGQKRYSQLFRVPGHRIVRHQSLAMVKSDHPRPLTIAVAHFLQRELARLPKAAERSVPAPAAGVQLRGGPATE
jgi:LysR family transcriptional activator of glutamate synthase operon